MNIKKRTGIEIYIVEKLAQCYKDAQVRPSSKYTAYETVKPLIYLIEKRFHMTYYSYDPYYPIYSFKGVIKDIKYSLKVRHGLKIGAEKPGIYAYSNVCATPFFEWQAMGGAWDSCGVWGANAYIIQRAWFAAGCKNNFKFRTILHAYRRIAEVEALLYRSQTERYDSYHHQRFVKKSTRPQQIIHIQKAICFLEKRNIEIDFNNKKLENLGRVSLPLKWALIRSNFDYSFAAKVQHWSDFEKSKLLSLKEATYFLGLPYEDGCIDHPYFKEKFGYGHLISRTTSAGEIEQLDETSLLFYKREIIKIHHKGELNFFRIGKIYFAFKEDFNLHVEGTSLRDAIKKLEGRKFLSEYKIRLNDVRNDITGTAGFCLAGTKEFLERRIPHLYRLIKPYNKWSDVPDNLMKIRWDLIGPEIFTGFPNPVKNIISEF